MKQTFKKKNLTSSTLSNILNSKITATQPFVLMPHRGQKRILSCFSSSLSHQHLNRCVVNPEEEKKIQDIPCLPLPLVPLYSLLQQEDQRIPPTPLFHPRGQEALYNPNTARDFAAASCPATFPLPAVSFLLPLQVLV